MALWFCAALLPFASGCGTFDPENAANRPWDRPTKADVYQNDHFFTPVFFDWSSERDDRVWSDTSRYP